jgi:hypothetical protein
VCLLVAYIGGFFYVCFFFLLFFYFKVNFLLIFFFSGTTVVIRVTGTRSRENASGLGRGTGQSIQKDIHESTRKRQVCT